MLLPSDIARLVLGYLQQEGLTATSRAFIFESPNLKEYAEHSSEDGIIPACVFSLFGKNLFTILNEYVAVKANETSQENQIPVVMTSLWKKLDFTLNQIKSMQNSPALQMNQRLRTKHHIQSMARQQRPISASQSPITGFLPVTCSVTSQCVPSPLSTPQGMLGHSTPVSYTSQYTRPSTLCLTQLGESPLQILVPDHRLNPGPLSPARRKCDSPRRRGGGQLGASGTSRSTVVSSTLVVETASEENVAENLSQIVIENAREKILNDRSLQEKLAENINKILASDNSPQTSKAACSTMEQEQSIDEILGLQGEIHMTDDAIHDILAQTESDPAFQALFDLFDYGKNNAAEGSEQADGSLSTIAQEESDETMHIDNASETGTTQEDSGPGGETPHPHILKQTATGHGPTNLKRGLTRSRALSGNKQTRDATSTTKLNSKADSHPPDQIASSSSFTEETVATEIDDLQDKTSENIQNPTLVPQESSLISNHQSDQIYQVSVLNKPPQQASITDAFVPSDTPVKETGMVTGGHPGANLDMTRTSVAVPSAHLSEPDLSVTPSHSADKTSITLTCSQHTDSSHKEAQPCVLRSTAGSVNSPALASCVTTSPPSTSLCVSDSQAKEPDPSKIVSLKIILSDEQDGQSSDMALNQAVSSITGDRIPTIFLSSPAKSPAKSLPTASAVITLEETAQAVNTLQGMEAIGSFGTPTRSVLNNVQAIVTRPVGQETGFIQLLPANPSYGPPGSYFVVTDPTTAEQRSNLVLLPNTVSQGTVSSSPHVVATPPRQRTVVSIGPNISQIGSTIIVSSPVQPMLQNVIVPVSVVGQNTGKLPNQMLSLPCSTSVRQPAKFISQPKIAPKENIDMGKPGLSGPGQVSKVLPQTSQSSDQPMSASGTSPSHRRILRFDTTPENTTAAQSSTQTTTLISIVTSPPTHQDKDNKRTEPNQLVVSDTSKKRIQPVRLPEVNHNTGKKDCEKSSVPLQQSEAQKSKVSEKRSIDQTAASARTFNKTASEPQVRLESQKKTQPSNKDGGTVSSAKSSAQWPKLKPASNTKNSTPEEPHIERSSDKISLQDTPGVTSNKENVLEGCQQEQCPTAARPPENLASSTAKPATPISSTSGKMFCKTSPLTKQAVEMLHDIKGQTPLKRQGASCPEIPLPRTPGPVRTQEEVTDGLRTPCRQRHGREGESTPRCLPPPATPDVPSCSPASEAGSENSINMAAHTLMILSRAARTGGPLKDSLRQEEASAGKSSAPKTKKRKHVEPSPPAKKELQLSGSSGSKKKSKKPKKLLDSFPDDLDVDKFLSSLHYDE
ncbi:protein NPAT isoform X2 [Triplophysa rosa]|uniref:protein NPAT isoform X2 n=1 Tax=Triplophysa rosa TaxID=992332 RepID=UPI002545F024|nr:protein NPAT isoform X2 [Triplophysa rosa]